MGKKQSNFREPREGVGGALVLFYSLFTWATAFLARLVIFSPYE
jgi:hypothetical protein